MKFQNVFYDGRVKNPQKRSNNFVIRKFVKKYRAIKIIFLRVLLQRLLSYKVTIGVRLI